MPTMDAALLPLDTLHLLHHRRGVAIDRFSSEMHAGSVFPAGAPCLLDWKLICVLDAVRSPRLVSNPRIVYCVFPCR